MSGRDLTMLRNWNPDDAIVTSRETEQEEVNRLFHDAFTGYDGAKVLELLRNSTIERRLPADCEVSALRDLEGQRRLVFEIEARIAMHRSENAPRSDTDGAT